jgi:hypothetical protein
VRAEVLPVNLAPNRREAWIASNVDRLDALIVNPKKVETGLDLIQFATCIFFELEFSLYTLWQAMRRVWRLGQTQPVKVLYAVYQGTLESAALTLMGEKMKAALTLYGDNASSAIADGADDAGQFMTELAKRVLAGEDLEGGVTGLLQQQTPQITVFVPGAEEAVVETPGPSLQGQPVVVEHREVSAAKGVSWLEFLAKVEKAEKAHPRRLARKQPHAQAKSPQLGLFEVQPSLF